MVNQERSLFPAQYETEAITRTPVRPLGSLSNYVIEGLPDDIDNIRRSFYRSSDMADLLSDRVKEITDEAGSEIVAVQSAAPEMQDLAMTDLLFLQTVVLKSNGILPENLAQAVADLSKTTGRIPWITYEDLVLTNPLNTDPRLILPGKSGKTELDFYETHRRIEGQFDVLIDAMVSAQDALIDDPDKIQEATEILGDESLRAAERYIYFQMMRIGRDLHKGPFDTFNGYFFTRLPLKGPSGAFSAGIPVIETILAGEHMPEERKQYHTENRQFFPRSGVAQMDRAHNLGMEGYSLLDLYRRSGNNPQLGEALRHIDSFMHGFRVKHFRAVEVKSPEALGVKARPGTNGEQDVEKFLKTRRDFSYFDEIDKPSEHVIIPE